jgi:hypothetical protein
MKRLLILLAALLLARPAFAAPRQPQRPDAAKERAPPWPGRTYPARAYCL